ncbi:hypothetical protein [Cohnella sp. JJ-181]|nr:hypothetical protein [Cohnella sp. JJ-181]
MTRQLDFTVESRIITHVLISLTVSLCCRLDLISGVLYVAD